MLLARSTQQEAAGACDREPVHKAGQCDLRRPRATRVASASRRGRPEERHARSVTAPSARHQDIRNAAARTSQRRTAPSEEPEATRSEQGSTPRLVIQRAMSPPSPPPSTSLRSSAVRRRRDGRRVTSGFCVPTFQSASVPVGRERTRARASSHERSVGGDHALLVPSSPPVTKHSSSSIAIQSSAGTPGPRNTSSVARAGSSCARAARQVARARPHLRFFRELPQARAAVRARAHASFRRPHGASAVAPPPGAQRDSTRSTRACGRPSA